MTAFARILVATDFGSSSVRAVHVAADLAARLSATLTVLHVIQDALPIYSADAAFPGLFGAREEPALSARQELDSFLGSLSTSATQCDGVVRIGEPAREIVAHAEEAAYDFVVLGTHGRHGLPRLLLGSVAERVVRSSHVPVLTVRADSEDTR